MADNTLLNPGAGGDTIRTLDKTGTGVPKTEVVALDLGGGDGSSEFITGFPIPATADSQIDDDGNPQVSLSYGTMDAIEVLFRQLIAASGYPQTPAEQAAQVTPIVQGFYPGDPRRYGAKGDGQTDDSYAFSQAMLVSNIHPTQIFATANGYIINKILTPISGTAIYGWGRPLLKTTVSGQPIMAASGLTTFTIDGVKFQSPDSVTVPSVGYGGFSPQDTGILTIDTSTDVRIYNCEVNTFYNGLCVLNSQRLWINGCRITNYTFIGIIVGSSTQFEVVGNDIVGCNQLGWVGTGSLSGTTFTVATTSSGRLNVNQTLFGAGIQAGGVKITAGSGTSWTIATSQGTIGTEAMNACDVCYGINATGNQAGGLTQKRNQIGFNQIADVPAWDAIGSHDCDGLEILGNDCRNVRRGIDVGHLQATNIIRNVVCIGNYIEATTTDTWGGQGEDHGGIQLEGFDGGTAAITGITQASQAVVTVTQSWNVNDLVTITGVVGMTQINGLTGTIQSRTGTSITLNINSSAFTAYSSGGTANDYQRRVQGVTVTGNRINNFFNLPSTAALAGNPGSLVISNADAVAVNGNIVDNVGSLPASSAGCEMLGTVLNGCSITGNVFHGTMSLGGIRLATVTADALTVAGNTVMQANPSTDALFEETGSTVNNFTFGENCGNSTTQFSSTGTLTANDYIAGPVTIQKPSGTQVALTVNGSTTTALAFFNGGASGQSYARWLSASTTIGFFGDSAGVLGTNSNDFAIEASNSLRLGAGGSAYGLVFDTSNNLIGRGVAICKRATSIETRTSTVTLTNSTQLTYAIPGAGTYAFEIVVFSYFTTAVTDGITANVNYSGTFTAAGSYLYGDLMNGTTTTTGIQPVEISSTVNNALAGLTMATYGAGVAVATPAVHFLKGNLIATASGTLAFAFAQSTSGVDTTNLGVGSWMTVTQLS